MITFLVLLQMISLVYAGFSCKNTEGNEVAWFYMLKFPLIEGPIPYLYFDSTMEGDFDFFPDFQASNTALNVTVLQYYSWNAPDDRIFLNYNDELPKPPTTDYYDDELPTNSSDYTSTDFGHIKGSFHYTGTSGYMLQHSLPAAILPNDNILPKNIRNNAQHVSCYTITESSIADISRMLFYTRPHFYTMLISQSYLDQYPFLKEIYNGGYQRNATEGQADIEIGEEKIPLKIMYQSCSYQFQTWGFVPAMYPDLTFWLASWWTVKDVDQTVRMDNVNKFEVNINGYSRTWTHGSDHSKYSVARGGNVFSTADINHTKKPKSRGCSVYCIESEELIKAFSQTFTFS